MPRRRALLLLLPVLSGILTWASFPKANLALAAWFSLVPLLLFVQNVQSARLAFLGGWIEGGIQFAALLYWVPPVMAQYGGLPAVLAWVFLLLMATVLGCYSGAACALTRFGMNRWGDSCLVAFAPAWVAMEYIRSWFPFNGFPWLLLGYSQTTHLPLIQSADLFGVYGLSFLVCWVNLAIAWACTVRQRPVRALVPLCVAVLILITCVLYGVAQLRRWDRARADHVAAMLQGNLSANEPDKVLAWKYKEGYLQMADGLNDSRVDLLVLPESPTPIIFQFDPGYRKFLQDLAHRYIFGAVFNNIRYEDLNGTSAYYNSAFFMNRSGDAPVCYDKIHLVPFGEYVPYKRLFFFSETISKDVGDFTPGGRFVTAPMENHVANALICFEAVFPALSREFVRRGSQLIVNLTNDGWYGDTSAPYQHLMMARWRAIEGRRWLLRAANTGISAIIAPSGRVETQTGILRKATLTGNFGFVSDQTFYVRYGDYFAILCVILCFWPLSGFLRPLLTAGSDALEEKHD